MPAALDVRAMVIREYVTRLAPPVDPATRYRYSVVAARWEALRLLIHRGQSVPTDDRRFEDLSAVLRALTAKIGLLTGTGPDAVAGITSAAGFLPLDLSELIAGETWQSAAEGWNAIQQEKES